jgi:hypothetical protein
MSRKSSHPEFNVGSVNVRTEHGEDGKTMELSGARTGIAVNAGFGETVTLSIPLVIDFFK